MRGEHSLGAESDLSPSLTEAQIDRIVCLGRERRLERGYCQGEHADHVFLLQSGRVKSWSVNAHGDETVLRVHVPSSLLGLTAIGIDPVRDATATALEDIQVIPVLRAQMLDLMGQDGALGVHITQLFLERLESFHFLVHSVLSSTVEQRVARALLGFSQPGDGSGRRDLRLSHQELAQIVGARRPTVSQALQHLAEAGMIIQERRRIAIVDPDKMSNFLTD